MIDRDDSYARFFTLSLDLLCIAGFDGYFKLVNPAWERTLGYSAAELTQSPFLDFVHPEDRAKTVAEVEKLSSGEMTISFENRYRARDGSYRNMLWNATPAVEQQLIYAAAHDITERKEAEEILRQFFDLSIDMLSIAGFDGYRKMVNPAWERILGYTPEELKGSSLLELVHPDDRAGVSAGFDRMRAGESMVSFEVRYRARDGSYRWLLWNGRPAVERRLIYAAARDITERKAADEKIAKLKQEAEDLSRAKGDFLARMSHEIRTPLNVIIGMGDVLERTPLNEEQRRHVRAFQKAGGNLLALIDDVLDLSKVESGRIVLEQTDFDPAAVAEEVVELLSVRARQKGLVFGCRIREDTPRRVIGDPARLRQVLINLAANAIKFTAQGSVSIEVEPDPDVRQAGFLRFSVSDTGIGVPPEKLDSIFEAFTQAEPSTTRTYGGTGLGLAISKHLVELMGGRIWAESAPGRGSTFRFTAWLAPGGGGAEAGTLAFPIRAAPAPTPGLRILVADDSGENRFLVAEFLKGLDCELDFAEDGKVALEKFCRRPPDLVLMDLRMPVMDGYEALRRIRGWESEQGRSPVPMVALTASALDPELQTALQAGATAWLRKPVRLTTLREAVAKYGGSRESAPDEVLVRPEEVLVKVDARLRAAIPGYLKNRRSDVTRIEKALAASDFASIRELGHKMSGSGGGYGFAAITEIGSAIEAAAKAGDAELIRSTVRELSRYLDRAKIVFV